MVEPHIGCVVGAGVIIVPVLFFIGSRVRTAHKNADTDSFWLWCELHNKFVFWDKDYVLIGKFVLIQRAILPVMSALCCIVGLTVNIIGAALAIKVLFIVGAIIVALPFVFYVVSDLRTSRWSRFSVDFVLLASVVWMFYTIFGADIAAIPRAVGMHPHCVILGAGILDVIRSWLQLEAELAIGTKVR